MSINFISLTVAPGGSVTCRALFVVSCGRDGWPLLFSNFLQKETFSGQNTLSQDW